ncbi:hypothetical protein O6H91_05G028400 [Diphasiastrum complanatum]|uniref:Uncharacterized protein n=1 Tax=Diphasiastrum complanatum TaxID=34168 RepID=A0ACC2DLR9_DIPCM|nr:hypothetical protein O6H91_05G028400 [Diphasiastrum complanatum]
MASQQHPYYPQTLQLPGYVPGSLSQAYIVGVYAAASIIVVSFVWFFSKKYSYLSRVERMLMCWWVFTGLTHMILEGYFVFTPDFYKKSQPIYLAEVWKEYSKGDSRYAARDPTIVGVEGITAVVEGPASLLAAYAIASKKPYQHTLQLAVSLGQLYGDLIYFATVFLQDKEFAAPGFLYFWFYFIFMNGIWIVIPAIIGVRSWRKITEIVDGKRKKL